MLCTFYVYCCSMHKLTTYGTAQSQLKFQRVKGTRVSNLLQAYVYH